MSHDTSSTAGKWTHFYDMHSGGSLKEPYAHIYIEAPEAEAKVIFYNRFGHNPERVTCTCCGEDYSISESESLEQLSGFQRNCEWDGSKYIEAKGGWRSGEYKTLGEHVKQSDVLIIRAADIKPEERDGEVPREGYVWI